MDLNVNFPTRGHEYEKDDLKIIEEILFNNNISLSKGNYVEKFEEKFSNLIGYDSYTTMSAAHSLDIAAMLINTNANDEIIIPAHTYCASALSFVRYNANIKWADINKESLTISLDSIKKLVTDKTKAIVVVHLYGLICPEIEDIVEFAAQRNIIVIEDCAQSLGAYLKDKSCGSFGDISCFSFHSQKNITTLGEGGMISVKSKEYSRLIPNYRHNGHQPFENKENYWLPAMVDVKLHNEGYFPFKSTISEIQGAIGYNLIDRLDNFTRRRRALSKKIRSSLEHFPELNFQKFNIEESHSHHLLPIRIQSDRWNRDDLILKLYNEYNIQCVIQYYPLNRYDLFKKLNFESTNLENTNYFFDNMMSVPFSITLTSSQVEYMIKCIIKSIQELNS
tara:strand:- start:5174 stop:6352 length:1179 start_codon:yes stop_codon:yes gene_type:complete